MAFFSFKKPKKTQRTVSFYDRENRIQNAGDLKFFFNQTASLTTSAPITFRGIPLSDITLEEIEAQLGEPIYIFDHQYRIAGHLVYYYKKKVEQLTLLTQLHFINEVFLLAVTKFSSDYVLGDADKTRLTAQIIKNYPGTSLTPEQYTLKFKDADGHVIFTEDNVFCFLHYVSNSNRVQKLKTQIDWENLTQTIPDDTGDSIDNFI